MGLKTEKIMIVEDSHSIRALIVSDLTRRGLDVYSTSSIKGAKAGLASFKPDIAILDLGLEDGDGNDLIRELQEREIMCLVLSQRDALQDKINSLTLGAQEYIIKPVDLDELYLRIRNLLTFCKSEHGDATGRILRTYGGAKVDVLGRKLISPDNKTSIELTKAEFKLLVELGEAGGVQQSREHLNRAVFGRKVFRNSRALDMLVSKIRKKLRLAGAGTSIVAMRGEGYAMTTKLNNSSSAPTEH